MYKSDNEESEIKERIASGPKRSLTITKLLTSFNSDWVGKFWNHAENLPASTRNKAHPRTKEIKTISLYIETESCKEIKTKSRRIDDKQAYKTIGESFNEIVPSVN